MKKCSVFNFISTIIFLSSSFFTKELQVHQKSADCTIFQKFEKSATHPSQDGLFQTKVKFC